MNTTRSNESAVGGSVDRFPIDRDTYAARHGSERIPALCRKKFFSYAQRNLPGVRLRRACVKYLGVRIVPGDKPPWIGTGVYLDDIFPELITMEPGCVLGIRCMAICHDDANRVIAPIVIGRDSYIGAGAILLPGVTIGRGATIGAGAVVTKNVPSGETWGGVPARKLEK